MFHVGMIDDLPLLRMCIIILYVEKLGEGGGGGVHERNSRF